jgi:hypothetical protein
MRTQFSPTGKSLTMGAAPVKTVFRGRLRLKNDCEQRETVDEDQIFSPPDLEEPRSFF